MDNTMTKKEFIKRYKEFVIKKAMMKEKNLKDYKFDSMRREQLKSKGKRR